MEAPHTPKKYRYMKHVQHVQLCHLYDLPRIRAYLWKGDQRWVAGLAGVVEGLASAYLSGRGSPSQAHTKLLWRLLLAKSLNNKSYASAVALHSKPVSSKALRAARSALLPHDHKFLAQFLGMPRTYIRFVACRSRTVIPEELQATAAAVVLRADYNQKLLQQIEPWLNGTV